MLRWRPEIMLLSITMVTMVRGSAILERIRRQAESIPTDNCGQLDIVFVIDSSGSINDAHPANWDRLLMFITDMINGGTFKVGQDAVRFAVIKYSKTAEVEFFLDAYHDNETLSARVMSTVYMGGRTNIAEALELARTAIFTAENGDRLHVQNVVILVTDGVPNEREADTARQADLLKANDTRYGAVVISVGITDAVDVAQLKDISSDHEVLSMADFVLLDLFVDKISRATCRANSPLMDACTKPIDLIFIVDSSGSIGHENWVRLLQFCSLIVNDLIIGTDDVRVGMVSYGNIAYHQFDLNTFTSKQDLMDTILNVTYKDEMTNTSGAIRHATDFMFQTQMGDRAGVQNIALVITDGEDNRDANLTTPEAVRTRSKGIDIIAVGIGKSIGDAELNGIGGDNVYHVTGFDVIQDIRSRVVTETCGLAGACGARNDVLFILDSSGSVSYDNFQTVKFTVADTVQDIVSVTGTRVGVMTFSDAATVHQYPDEYTNSTTQARAIRDIVYVPGTTNTAEALRYARQQVFRSGRDRPGVQNVIVLLTDGGSNDFEATIKESIATKMAGIHTIVVGVTSWVNMAEINAMATDPVADNVIMADNFAVIGDAMRRVQKVICTPEDPCESSPCMNGATCQPLFRRYACLCVRGFAGDRCQHVCKERADVTILIDSSSSIQTSRYYDMLSVVRQLLKQLPIYEDIIRAAVITFSTQAEVRLSLNDMKDKISAEETVMFGYRRGTTNTASALNLMENDIFGRSADRRDVHNVALLLTDGQSNNRSATFKAAARCHYRGTHIIATGIGMKGLYQQRELRSIATDPDEYSLINIDSFEELREKGKEIILPVFMEAVCNNIDECEANRCQNGARCVDKIFSYECLCPTGYSGKYCDKACNDNINIVFAVDVSGSIRRSRLEIIKQFISAVISDFNIGEGHARIGVLTFSDTAEVNFHLNTHTSQEDIMQAVQMLPYTMGRTNIAEALRVMRNMFLEQNGDRLHASNIGIVITDGIPTLERDQSLPEAIRTRLDGIHLMAVVAESDPESLMFKGIASDPDEFNIFSAPRFGDLLLLSEKVRNSICDGIDECLSVPCQNNGQCLNRLGHYLCVCPDQYTGQNCERICRRRYDIAFVLDASGSTSKTFDQAQQLAKRIVLGLNFNGGRTRVGMVTYSDSATVRFRLDSYTSQMEVINAISFEDENSQTNTASGLKAAESLVLVSGNGDRAGDPNVVIVVTDGYSNQDSDQTISQARDLTRSGTRIMVVALGRNIHHQEINGMASDPDTENVILLPDPELIGQAANAVLDRLCNN